MDLKQLNLDHMTYKAVSPTAFGGRIFANNEAVPRECLEKSKVWFVLACVKDGRLVPDVSGNKPAPGIEIPTEKKSKTSLQILNDVYGINLRDNVAKETVELILKKAGERGYRRKEPKFMSIKEAHDEIDNFDPSSVQDSGTSVEQPEN